ncbi:ATP-binding protein [Nocardioides gilvus]|uniref:ATP-binding protein n=1 Tax=Nocardioides gilvus TaxID=1735589 RepID=UPI000D74C3E6|nr:ATP-binding protein [Nocardioides gilvus]
MSPRRGTTTQEHARALTLAGVTALLNLAETTLPGGVDELVERQPFVAGYVDELARVLPDPISWEAAVVWWHRHLADLERAAPAARRGSVPPLPLTLVPGLAEVRDRIAVGLVALPEEDERFTQVVRELQGVAPAEGMPTAVVVGALERPGERVVARLLDRLTRDQVLIEVPGVGQARRVAPSWWASVRDDEAWADFAAATPAGDPSRLRHWHRSRREELVRLLRMLEEEQLDTVVIRQVPGADGAASVAAASTRRLLWRTPDELLRGPGLVLAASLDAIPAVSLSLVAGEEIDVPRPPGYSGPLVVLTGVAGGLRTTEKERSASLTLHRGDADERHRLWKALFPRAGDVRLTELAAACVVPDGHLRRLAADATVIARLDGRRLPGVDDVRAASRRLCDHVLETRATRIDNEDLSWDDVVTSAPVRTDLEMLESRCRLRETLAVGDRGVGGAGVRALLTGASGCGKTLAARTLASVLGRSIYRVDLAAVFDKYVGVTEKILDGLLTEAEQLDAVLLLDEGDTFLGSRTDVRSANDRYANLETNFLLQRLETYSGIIVVTTNSPDRIDTAFNRRMDATILFGKPRAEARAEIWSLHLPDGHQVGPEEVALIGQRHRLTGGQIRNAVQYARLLSARDERPLDARTVRDAIAAEYRKAGAMPLGLSPAPPDSAVALDTYVRSVAEAAPRRAGRRK